MAGTQCTMQEMYGIEVDATLKALTALFRCVTVTTQGKDEPCPELKLLYLNLLKSYGVLI
jgi:hypothetical protein